MHLKATFVLSAGDAHTKRRITSLCQKISFPFPFFSLFIHAGQCQEMFVSKTERLDEPQTLFSVTICPLNIYVFLKYLDMRDLQYLLSKERSESLLPQQPMTCKAVHS